MIALDTSALVKRYREEPHSDWVGEIMSADRHWVASALISVESALAIGRDPGLQADLPGLDDELSGDLARFDLVPVDAACLAEAIEIGRDAGLRTLDAIHLAATRRLPGECRFLTFDESQRDAAERLGIKVLTPLV